MVDRYYRKIEDVENDIENSMQISSILLKLKGYDNDLGKISTNTGAISTNSGQISTNTGSISTNSGLISTNTGDISTNSGLISTNTGSISTNSGLISTNTLGIASNLLKINNIENDIKITNDIYNETFVISNMSTSSRSKNIFEKIINSNFTTNGIIKINANCNYIYDAKYNFKHIYYFFNDNNKVFKKISFYNNRVSNVVKDEFNIESVDSTSIRILICLSGNLDYKKIELFGNNTIQIIYNETDLKLDINKDNIASNLKKINDNVSDISNKSGLINANTSSIADNLEKINDNSSDIESNLEKINDNSSDIESNLEEINDNSSDIESNLEKINDNSSDIESNLEKINDNKDDIIALQNSNVKAFYNLDEIFIYDIEKGDQTVNKDKHFHIFEKEMYYNFVKNSYLEIILKVLTEISNYVLIGFFQILCNFYDESDDLFYTISLSTAMGSIDRLSTIKSVFTVPINKNMTKIKIDFFIMPKPTQQNRSAKFIIKDINSNKICVKYFQKTEEMSIKSIEDKLNKVDDIKIYLKNLFNIIYHENDIEVTHIFFEKAFLLNAKKDDFIEIHFKMLIQYENTQDSKHITTNFIIYDENNIELLSISYDNIDFLSNSNTNILLKNNFSYYFDKDVNNLKIIISFTKRRSYVTINYKYVNNNRLILKHYGN